MIRFISNKGQLQSLHNELDKLDLPVKVSISKGGRRSLEQNSRLHCMIRALSQHTGHTERELKDFFKAEYGPKKRLQVGMEGREIPLSTTQYTKPQMADLMFHIDRVCAECGVYVED